MSIHQELIAHGLRAWLADVDDMEVVAYANTGTKLFTELRTVKADLVLIDISIAKDGRYRCHT